MSPVFPVATVIGLGLIGFGLYSTYYSNDLNRGLTNQRLGNFGIDVGLSLIPFIGPEGKIVKTLVSSDAVIGKIVLSKGNSIISNRIVTRSSFVFERYLIEKGETKLLYGGLSRISTKYGTLESAFMTRYGYNKNDQFKKLIYEYVQAKISHYTLNWIFEGFNFNDAFYDTFELNWG